MISAIGKLAECLAVHGLRAVRGAWFWGGSLAAAVLVLSTAMALMSISVISGRSSTATLKARSAP